MTDTEEIAKLVDGTYKNILEKFNPCARQLITAGKAYLKALHGAVSASKVYIEAIHKLARHAHQGTWGGCTDIGTALMQLLDVQKEIQAQQMNILKAFYVDLLVPLETNLEKDAKIVATEHKKFLQQHKSFQDGYLKAVSTVKKQRKKNRSSRSSNIDKEIKQMQIMEEEKMKLDHFCVGSLKQAITQERRRYGFVLERQCSLTKHRLVYHSKGQALLQHHLEEWNEVAAARELLPETMEKLFPSSDIRISSEYASSNILLDVGANEPMSISSYAQGGLRKTRSIDASCGDLCDVQELNYQRPLSRAKSDFNLASSSASLVSSEYVMPLRPKSMVESAKYEIRQVKALYSYLSSGEHQLSFHEGDVIALIGERNKGWQYGENLRNHRCGWFPIAYTEPITSNGRHPEGERHIGSRHPGLASPDLPTSLTFSDFTTVTHHTIPIQLTRGEHTPIIAPTLLTFSDPPAVETAKIRPPVVPSFLQPPPPPSISSHPSSSSASTTEGHPVSPPRPPRRSLTSPLPLPHPGSTSLHSSNDSGFCNDSSPHPANPTEGEVDRQGENIFAGVKLRKVLTNDRSAPMLS